MTSLMVENFPLIFAIAIACGLCSVFFLFLFLTKLLRLKMLAAVNRLALFCLFAFVCCLSSFILVAGIGYQALTHEEPVARVEIRPQGNNQFSANLIFNNGKTQHFFVQGDQVIVEAYILKWKPWANMLGLHSAYRLDRISGRFSSIEQQKITTPSIHALTQDEILDLVQWRAKYEVLSHLLDVEHGSASFVSADNKAAYQLMVTNDGLLMRPVAFN